MSNKQEEQMDTEKTYDRPLPHNYEAERVVLGAMLMDPDAFDEAVNVVDENDFFRVAHQHLFKTMVELKEKGLPPNQLHQISLPRRLKAMEAALTRGAVERLVDELDEIEGDGNLDELGGTNWVAYMEMLVTEIPNTAHVTSYARIVKEKSTLRGLIYAAGRILSAAYGDLNEKEPDTH